MCEYVRVFSFELLLTSAFSEKLDFYWFGVSFLIYESTSSWQLREEGHPLTLVRDNAKEAIGGREQGLCLEEFMFPIKGLGYSQPAFWEKVILDSKAPHIRSSSPPKSLTAFLIQSCIFHLLLVSTSLCFSISLEHKNNLMIWDERKHCSVWSSMQLSL